MNIDALSSEAIADIARTFRERQLEERFAELGREKLYEDCTNTRYARYYIGCSYEDWLSNAVPEIPSWMSRDEFMELYGERLRDEYEAQRKQYSMDVSEEGE